MRRPAPQILSLFVLVVTAAGCQSGGLTPLEEVVAGRETFTATEAAINLAHRQGYVTVEQKVQIAPYVKAARAALDAWEAAALAGSDRTLFSDFNRYASAFRAAMDELLKVRLEAEKVKSVVERSRAAGATTSGPSP